MIFRKDWYASASPHREETSVISFLHNLPILLTKKVHEPCSPFSGRRRPGMLDSEKDLVPAFVTRKETQQNDVTAHAV